MKLAVLVFVFLVAGFGSCSVKGQTPLTSQNIITPTVGAWTGSVAGQNGGYSGGGSGPAYNQTTDTLIFGYTTATAAQRISAQAFAIQHALDLSNSGIKIQGYNYSWQINNSGQQSGTLAGKVELLRGTTALETYNYNYNAATNGFELKTGTQNFANEYSMLASDAMRLSFTGKDSRFWAGYYGPQVREPSLTLNYTTDPCMANPLYSPSCAGYNNILTSQNITAQSYAINQALNLSGSGVQINGLDYGYSYYVGGNYCHFSFIVCFDWRPSSMDVNVNVTSNTGSSLYAATHSHGSNTSGEPSYSFIFPQQILLSSMGTFSLSTSEIGTTALYSSWSRWKYTPDPCVADPLSSTSCSGYQAAYFTQQCNANPLYNPACPGYAVAYFNQQCTVNQLYNPSCPGYASAYLIYQCSANPLYSTTCAGYQQAYHDQQCSFDPLFATDCPGYAAAYKSQQCSLNGLYDRTCPNYNEAYAKKMLLEQQGLASTVATAGVIAQTAPTTTTVSSDGTLSSPTTVSTTGSSAIDKAITPTTSTTNSSTAPAAPVQLVAPPPAPAAPQQQAQQEKKPEGGGDKQGGEKKPEGGPTQMAGPQQDQGGGREQPKTARQELQERRQAAAKAEAVEKGKNLANEMGKAADMEAQKAVQNVVIQAMGFTPGFDSYGKAIVPDTIFYKPYSVYGNQQNVDNRRLGRGLFGPTDQLHNKMVEQQYESR